MHRRLPIIAVIVTWLAASFAASLAAQQPAPAPAAVKAAQDLLAALGSAKQFDAVLPLIMQQTRTLMVQGRPEIANKIDEVMPILLQRFAARKSELFDEVALVYARKVPIADLQAMTSFFASEPGRRFVALQPELTQETMQIGQRWGQKLGQQVDIELREELKKRGIQL